MAPTGAGRSGGEVDVFSEEELARRPEVRIINKYALGRAYFRIGLRGIGALALLWATVVLLGGFVSVLNKTDFWYITSIAFLQAAGLLDAMGDDRFAFFGKWIGSLLSNIKRPKKKISSRIRDFLLLVIFSPVAYFAMIGPIICIALSAIRLRKQDYGSSDGAASQANLKPALKLFYFVSLVHSAICFVVFYIETMADDHLVDYLSQKYGFSPEVLDGYFQETKRTCVNNPASTESWNLMTYGAGLLDSELPEDYALGVRVVTMLIEHDIPIRRMLIRSPRRRILKLIGDLVWRSPVDGETRWLAARIVEHTACDLNLAQFPGASECVSSLLDTSCHNTGDHEALQLLTGHSKARRKGFLFETLLPVFTDLESRASRNGGREDSKKLEEHVDNNAAKGRPDFARPKNTVRTNGDLILLGLRILDNLAHNQHNCTVIYNTKGLISKIVAPVSSNKLTEDIDINAEWIQVVDASLKVVSRLMRAPGDIGKEMRRKIADSSNAIGNLEAILSVKGNSSCILELQMRAMEVLAKLFFHGSTSWAGERSKNFIGETLDIFCTVEWMEYYLAEEKRIKNDKDEIKEAKETASRLKEKAGEALAMLSLGNSETILHNYSQTNRSFADVVHRLTEMLDSKAIKCRISAAVVLKHLCPHFATTDDDYVKKITLKKVLVELLHITTESQAQESTTSTFRWWEHCIAVRRNDIENPRDGDQDKCSAVQSHRQQSEERRLHAELLSLCTNICARYSIKAPYLTTMVAQQVSREDFVGKLKKMVEENSHATPACLAILKLTCQMVKELISDDQTGKEMETKKTITGVLSQIVVKLSEASKTIAGVESCMLFSGTNGDCYGVPARPLLSVLVKQAEERLERRKDEGGMNVHAGGQ